MKANVATACWFGSGCWSRPTISASGAGLRFGRWLGSVVIITCIEDHFFELAGTLTVEIEFILTDDEAQKLLDMIRQEKIRAFYAFIPARFGVINPDQEDTPDLSANRKGMP